MRSWRRSSGRSSSCLLASQVKLGGKLLALSLGCHEGHRKAVLEQAGDDAFHATDMVQIGDHTVAELAPGHTIGWRRCRATCRSPDTNARSGRAACNGRKFSRGDAAERYAFQLKKTRSLAPWRSSSWGVP